jgi:hypothetical protein
VPTNTTAVKLPELAAGPQGGAAQAADREDARAQQRRRGVALPGHEAGEQHEPGAPDRAAETSPLPGASSRMRA